MKPLILIICLFSFGVGNSQNKHNPSKKRKSPFTTNPTDAKLHTEDIFSFWKVFDETYPELNANEFQEKYIKPGSPGLQGFLENRIKNGNNLTNVVRANLLYYQNIRESSLSIATRQEGIYEALATLKSIYPEAVFPDVYFVIGSKNSGGTAFDGGLIIGAEMFGVAKEGFKPVLNIEDLNGVVAHELVHFQQKYAKDNSLLTQCIREGSADFLASLMMERQKDSDTYRYGEDHESELWAEFLEAKDKSEWSNWLYSSKDKSRPRDLGYWMGFKITKAYYDRAEDKSVAVKEILNIQDFKAFLAKSGYQGD